MKGSEVELVCYDGFSMSTGLHRVICKGDLLWSTLTVTCSVFENCKRDDLKVIYNSYPNWSMGTDVKKCLHSIYLNL